MRSEPLWFAPLLEAIDDGQSPELPRTCEVFAICDRFFVRKDVPVPGGSRHLPTAA